jgi:hypothetical protein
VLIVHWNAADASIDTAKIQNNLGL